MEGSEGSVHKGRPAQPGGGRGAGSGRGLELTRLRCYVQASGQEPALRGRNIAQIRYGFFRFFLSTLQGLPLTPPDLSYPFSPPPPPAVEVGTPPPPPPTNPKRRVSHVVRDGVQNPPRPTASLVRIGAGRGHVQSMHTCAGPRALVALHALGLDKEE